MYCMRVLLLAVALAALCVWGAPAAKQAPVNPKAPVQVQASAQKSAFDGTVIVLKKQLSDIEKAKADRLATQAMIEKDAASLTVKSDSVYTAAKAELKAIYDKELEQMVAKEQAMKQAKERLAQEYTDALKALDEAKGIKK